MIYMRGVGSRMAMGLEEASRFVRADKGNLCKHSERTKVPRLELCSDLAEHVNIRVKVLRATSWGQPELRSQVEKNKSSVSHPSMGNKGRMAPGRWTLVLALLQLRLGHFTQACDDHELAGNTSGGRRRRLDRERNENRIGSCDIPNQRRNHLGEKYFLRDR